jgi:hypothetical protein
MQRQTTRLISAASLLSLVIRAPPPRALCCRSFAFCITYAVRFRCPGVVSAFRPPPGVHAEAAAAISRRANNLNQARDNVSRLNLSWSKNTLASNARIFYSAMYAAPLHVITARCIPWQAL